MIPTRQQLYNRIRNLKMLHKFLINGRSYNALAKEYKITEYKITIPSVDNIIRKQITDYNFYILSWNKTLEINTPAISKELKGFDEEYRLFNYIYQNIVVLRDLILKEETT
jgi:hypothetical protein